MANGDDSRQAIVDQEHLRLLSIGYYISAGVCSFLSLFGLMYTAMGIIFITLAGKGPSAGTTPNDAPPAIIGWVFGGLGCGMFLLLIILAALKFRTARCIKNRRSRVFCMVIGGISCLEIPYGTALGIFTFNVLGRDSVRQAFEPPSDFRPE